MRWSDFELAPTQTDEFTIENKRSEHCVTISDAGSFSCLRVRFKLKRKFGTAFTSYMLPVSLFVFVAYLTFWIPSGLPATTSQMSNQMANQMASTTALFGGHLIQVRVLLLVYSLSALYWKASINESSLPTNQQTNRTASITMWHFVNLTFVLVAIVEYIAQLNQSGVRNFLLRKLLKDAGNLANSSGQNYGTVDNNRNATLTLHPKHSTKVNGANNANHNNSGNLPISNQEPPAEANRSADADKRSDAQAKNRIYLKMLGLKNGRHQSSGQIAGEQELGSKDYDARHAEGTSDWLDRLFRVFYPIFYVAFLCLFLFITLISW